MANVVPSFMVGIELPEDPGKDVLFSGNVLEEQNRY